MDTHIYPIIQQWLPRSFQQCEYQWMDLSTASSGPETQDLSNDVKHALECPKVFMLKFHVCESMTLISELYAILPLCSHCTNWASIYTLTLSHWWRDSKHFRVCLLDSVHLDSNSRFDTLFAFMQVPYFLGLILSSIINRIMTSASFKLKVECILQYRILKQLLVLRKCWKCICCALPLNYL